MYDPLCLWPTSGIIKELPRLPIGIVVMPRSEVMLDPWNDQVMVSGWSPLVTMQETCANDPSSIISWPKLRGSKFGGSDEDNNINIKSIV